MPDSTGENPECCKMLLNSLVNRGNYYMRMTVKAEGKITRLALLIDPHGPDI
jgi:hypothetical protein